MIEPPKSIEFDDVYFSPYDGLAETRHVFLDGNDLPNAWQGGDSFTIAETGFGTGLNFFATWKLFEETANSTQTLDYISIEKFPVTPDFIRNALKPWESELGNYVEQFLAQYPIRISGFHRIKFNERVTLTLIFDDAEKALNSLYAKVDCWFLDGFTPAKNPDMWSEGIFKQMARLSYSSASFATFTAASNVKHGLETVGFDVEKTKAFHHKRDMLIGKCSGQISKNKTRLKCTSPLLNNQKNIAIIGGGIAGTSCAHTLKKYGFTSTIFEASSELAAGASGNTLGLFNPRFSKLQDAFSDFYASAYAQFIRTAQITGNDIDYKPNGTLHMIHSASKAGRLESMAKNWLWHSDHVRLVSSEEASRIAGLVLDHSAVYLPHSGSISPNKLCHYYAQDIEIKLNQKISNDDLAKLQKEYDAVILTNGINISEFSDLSWLETDIIRGQVSVVKSTEKTEKLKCNICYSGYLSPAQNGYHITGSTFDKGNDSRDITLDDHTENISKIKAGIPSLELENLKVKSGWSGIRLATRDRFPVIGAVPNTSNMYVLTALGSHGIVGSIAGAHLIADYLRGGPLSISPESAYELSPQRFIDRAAKRGHILI